MNIKRRDFLKVAVTCGATLALPAPAEARPNLEVPPNAIGMLYDATLCIGCKACMVGCKDANDMPELTRSLIEGTEDLLDLRNFELDNMTLKFQAIDIQSDNIIIAAKAEIQSFD